MIDIRTHLDDILKREGWPLVTNYRFDRGGYTKGGITLATLSAWRGSPQTPNDLINLHESDARAIYRQKYLAPWEFITHAGLFGVLVDYAVTSGHDDPTKALQEKVGVTVDGVLGPKTREAVLAADPVKLREYVIGYRVRHMVNLAVNDSKLKAAIAGHDDLQLLNLRGWIARATAFLG